MPEKSTRYGTAIIADRLRTGEAMRHQPADDASCLFIAIFDGPVDSEPLEE